MSLKPRQPVPELEFDTVGGGRWPFARPHFDEMGQAIDFVLSKNYPARGEA